MTSALRRVLVCSPRAAGWDCHDTADEWEGLGFVRPPSFAVAQSQHDDLCTRLQLSGVEVIHLPGSPKLTLDAIYTHDASFMTDSGAIVMNPGKRTRRIEGEHHRTLFESIAIPIFGTVKEPGITEAGDILWLDSGTLLVGNGFRTNTNGIGQLQSLLEPHNVDVISASLPYGTGPSACLHLMSLMSLLDQTTVLVDLPWLSVETVELLKSRRFRLIQIDYSERESLACNVLALGGNRLLALEENQKTNQRLREAGFEVQTFAGSELCINGGGGPTCLTRPLLRSDVA